MDKLLDTGIPRQNVNIRTACFVRTQELYIQAIRAQFGKQKERNAARDVSNRGYTLRLALHVVVRR